MTVEDRIGTAFEELDYAAGEVDDLRSVKALLGALNAAAFAYAVVEEFEDEEVTA